MQSLCLVGDPDAIGYGVDMFLYGLDTADKILINVFIYMLLCIITDVPSVYHFVFIFIQNLGTNSTDPFWNNTYS